LKSLVDCGKNRTEKIGIFLSQKSDGQQQKSDGRQQKSDGQPAKKSDGCEKTDAALFV
jgi:hypothetical protein